MGRRTAGNKSHAQTSAVPSAAADHWRAPLSDRHAASLDRRALLGHPLAIGWYVALATLSFTLATLGPTTGGPGVTVDEFYDAAAGKRLVHALRTQGSQFFQREQIEQTYGALTLHPPLGRWMIGCVHHVVDAYPDELAIVWLPGARAAAALALALLVGLVGTTAAFVVRGADRALAAGGAAVATALMPRLFAQGHLVSLDLFEALFFFAAVAALLRGALGGKSSTSLRVLPGKPAVASRFVSEAEHRDASLVEPNRLPWVTLALAGAVWGLALSTKISGVLLVPAAGAWLLVRFRAKGIALFLVWLTAGCFVFFALWPWLWDAPLERTLKFLSTATERATLHTYYLGRVWDDRDTPWHYPWVIAGVTIPIGWLALAMRGAWSGWRDTALRPVVQLVLLTIATVLLTFSWPGVPVYDGERLFLMIYPLVGLLVGIGVATIARVAWFVCRQQLVIAAGVILVAAQAAGVVLYHPFQLSYYNLLVGGLRGAERLGFEVTYWGDTVDHTIADVAAARAARGAVLFAPHLAPFQAQAVEIVNPAFEAHGARVIGWPADAANGPAPRYLLVYNRRADAVVPEEVLAKAKLVAENRRQGVWLARLYELPR